VRIVNAMNQVDDELFTTGVFVNIDAGVDKNALITSICPTCERPQVADIVCRMV